MEREVKRKTIFYGFTAILLAILLTIFCLNLRIPQSEETLQQISQPTLLKTFNSFEELETFISKRRATQTFWNIVSQYGRTSLAIPFTINSNVKATTAESPLDYSTTNIQVAGVDEPDIVKADGRYIYTISNNGIFIVKAYPPEKGEMLSVIELNGEPLGIFVNGDRLVAFTLKLNNDTETLVEIYDISDRRDPVLNRKIAISGVYFDSRMIGDYVYVVVNKYAIREEGNEIRVELPKIRVNSWEKEIKPTEIHYVEYNSYFDIFTVIAAINVRDDSVEPSYETIVTGPTTCIYMSRSNLYIAIPNTAIYLLKTVSTPTEETLIYRVHVEGEEISCEASGKVPGRVLNQFSMDEHSGYFRIATTTGYLSRKLEEATAKNHIYILDMNLTIVGKLENLAPGEKIYSARFMGNRCYLVTFRKVDPLFVIDLSNPKEPKVLGKLKIPGYSDYLHPYDENHLIGIGKWTVEAEEGDFAWYQGIKISIFDVSNVTKPIETDYVIIGDRGTDSPVLRDHHSLLFSKERDLLALPILLAEINESKYPDGKVPPYVQGEYVWQGLYVFNITESSIELRGRITHIEPASFKSGFWPKELEIKRALYIDGVLYTISDNMIKMNDINSLEELNSVSLITPK